SSRWRGSCGKEPRGARRRPAAVTGSRRKDQSAAAATGALRAVAIAIFAIALVALAIHLALAVGLAVALLERVLSAAQVVHLAFVADLRHHDGLTLLA